MAHNALKFGTRVYDSRDPARRLAYCGVRMTGVVCYDAGQRRSVLIPHEFYRRQRPGGKPRERRRRKASDLVQIYPVAD